MCCLPAGAPDEEFLSQEITSSDNPFLRANVQSIKAHTMAKQGMAHPGTPWHCLSPTHSNNSPVLNTCTLVHVHDVYRYPTTKHSNNSPVLKTCTLVHIQQLLVYGIDGRREAGHNRYSFYKHTRTHTLSLVYSSWW